MLALSGYATLIDNPADLESNSCLPRRKRQKIQSRQIGIADPQLVNLPNDILGEIVRQNKEGLFQNNFFYHLMQVSRSVQALAKAILKEWFDSSTLQAESFGLKTTDQLVECIVHTKPNRVSFGAQARISLENLNRLVQGYSGLMRLELRSAAIEAIPQGFRKLQELNLAECDQIVDENLESLQTMRHLRILILTNCNQITDEGFCHFQKLTKLEILDLSHCFEIVGKGFVYLRGLINLKKLMLFNCDWLADKWLECLKELPRLEELDLRKCLSLKQKSLSSLSSFPALKILKFSGIDEKFEQSEFRKQGRLATIDVKF